MIGILAVKLALGDGGKTTNQSGALRTIAHQPFGEGLLILVAIGLAGYSLWRLFRAFLGHGPEDSDSGLDRVSAFASGIAYALIFVLALEILLGSGASSGSPKKPTAGVLGWPAGTWLVGIAGAVLCGVGLYQGYRGTQQGLPQGLEDRADEPRHAQVDHRDRRRSATWRGWSSSG